MAVPGSRDVHLDAPVAGGDDGGERGDGVGGRGRRPGASEGHAAEPTVPWAHTMGSGREQKAGEGASPVATTEGLT